LNSAEAFFSGRATIPIIARQLLFQNSVENHYVPLGTLLPGMPASYEEVIALVNQAGSWTE
jgi:hypothetical protein